MTVKKKHRRPRGKCGKAIYWDIISAKLDLARWRSKDGEVMRVQRCNICWGEVFHLTKQERRSDQPDRIPQSIDAESTRAIA